ncbi:tetrapyrrole biosynthesis, uroporphyrinogen III synthase [Syncephalis fuscata]|nr:tetrapyrrole biosynthesis, uroporphyrinogen III synthase [Syncephalis fuscata]
MALVTFYPMTLRILLLRRSTDDGSCTEKDVYIREFTNHFEQVQCIAPLADQWIAEGELARLVQEVPKTAEHWGVVVTSKRAVKAFAQVLSRLDDSDSLLRWWRTVVWFAVGPSTAATLQTMLGVESLGSPAGEAEGLADVIIDTWSTTTTTTTAKTLLFLSGEQRRNTLPRRLAAAACPFQELAVYAVGEDAQLATQLKLASTAMLQYNTGTNWLAFFSPSGANIALPYLTTIPIYIKKHDEQHLAEECAVWRVAAIGQTTAAALSSAGIRVDAVAKSPSAQGLLEAVQQCNRHNTI